MAPMLQKFSTIPLIFALLLCHGCASTAARSVALFDGETLAGWQGYYADPYQKQLLDPEEKEARQRLADQQMRQHWSVEKGVLCFDGKGVNLVTSKDYRDFELTLEWLIIAGGDSGIYLRGCPQVQIWDHLQNPGGSGGLYNNQHGGANPAVVADFPPGEWNRFRIILRGERVTVYLNDRLVVNDTVLENYWRRSEPIPPIGPIELQSHGSPLKFRNLVIKEL